MEFPQSIILAIAAIRDSVGTVEKDSKNAHFGYSYVSEREMQAAIRPLLAEHGLVIIPSASTGQHAVTDEAGYYNYMAAFRLCHVDGSVWPEPIYVPAQDKGDKAAWKANTGAMKYLLNRLFMLDTGDDPEGKDDAAKKSPRTPPQRDTTKYSPPPQSTAPPTSPPASSGGMLSKDDIKTLRIYHKGFKAAEAAHGKDEAMKWHAINAACQVVSSQDKLHNVPASQGEYLVTVIDSYIHWWNHPGGFEGWQNDMNNRGDDVEY
jgi:hypothetical protein